MVFKGVMRVNLCGEGGVGQGVQGSDEGQFMWRGQGLWKMANDGTDYSINHRSVGLTEGLHRG